MTKLLALLIALVTTLTIFNTGAAAKPYYHKHQYYTHKHYHKHTTIGVLPTPKYKTAEDLAFSPTPIAGSRNGRMIYPQYTVSDGPLVTNSDIVQVASNYVGLNSHANRRDLMNLFDAASESVDPTRTPWCAAFANAILAKIGIHGTNSLQAGSFATWGKHTATPKKNDIVLLSFGHHRHHYGIDHVGFYVETITMSGVPYVVVLGGNQSHNVQVSYFPAWQVVSYRTGS